MLLSFYAKEGVNASGGTTKIATILEVLMDPKKKRGGVYHIMHSELLGRL